MEAVVGYPRAVRSGKQIEGSGSIALSAGMTGRMVPPEMGGGDERERELYSEYREKKSHIS